jgi:hypothetical protein
MKLPFFRTLKLAAGLGLACSSSLVLAQAGDASASPGNTTTNLAALLDIPQSVFTVGRNPFFPQSTIGIPVPKAQEAPVDTSSFVLNGITPSGPKRTAMINNRTFEAGEEGEVKLPSGAKAMIKCEAIKAESAIILYEGQRRELRLRLGVF